MQVLQVHPGPRALQPLGLLLAACWAALGALAGREGGVLGCAAAGAVGVWIAVAGPWRTGWTAALALPAALGALELPAPQPVWPAAGPVWVEGMVAGAFARDTTTGTLRFELDLGGGVRALCAASLRPGEGPDTVLPGDRVRGPGFFRDPEPRLAEGRPPIVEVELAALEITRGAPSPRRLSLWCRLRLEEVLCRLLPGEPGKVASHLVLGRGPRLADDLADAHRATGLAHLLAVSGAHATILAWMMAAAFAAARGRDPWQARGFRRGCGLFLCAYGAVTGFDPPVVRALCAWLLVAVAVARGRRPTVVAALALPTLVTAAVAPRDLFSVSFCLSYAAVIGLAAAGAFRRPEGLREHLGQALRASIWAMLATSPLTLLYFGQVSPWTVLGTPILAPLVAVMLALGIVCALCGVALPVLAALPAAPLGFLTEGYTAAVRLLATLPGAPIQAPLAPSPLLVAGYALLGVALVVVRPRRGSLALACVLASAPHFVGPVPAAAPALTLGAVGHGQAAVARLSDGAALVVDCGNLNDPRRAVREVLDALGPRRRIDHLVLSHGDADHAGGVSGLATRVPIAAAVLPVELRGSPLARTLAARGTALQFARPGEQLRPHPEVLVIAPAVGPRAARNDRSLWTLVEVGGQRVVLPGDAEAEGIRAALRELPDGPTTALVLPHHGRGPAASFERLLDELRPGLALVSTGGAAPMAAAVHARGIPLLSTYEHGALRLELDGPARVSAARPRQSVPIEAGRR